MWKYLDDGSDQDTAWTARNFDDSSWHSGPAQLGYGDGDKATTVSYGPNQNSKYITTYFRHSFVVTNAAAYSNLTLRLLRDDGAVIYLNGMEIARVGIPYGTVTPQTLATSCADENVLFVSSLVNLNLFPGLLVNGTNVLAVEIHQASPASTDISFDLELADEPVTFTSIIDLTTTNAAFASSARLSLTTKAGSQAGRAAPACLNAFSYVRN